MECGHGHSKTNFHVLDGEVDYRASLARVKVLGFAPDSGGKPAMMQVKNKANIFRHAPPVVLG